MAKKPKHQRYKVVLGYDFGITRSVFIRARNREAAEKLAMRRNPKATHINRSPSPEI